MVETRKDIAELDETQVMLVQVAKTEMMTSAEGRQVMLSASAETRKVMVEVEGTQVVLAIMGVTQVVMAKVRRMKVMFSEMAWE